MAGEQSKPARLSKGRILAWKQCPKRLFLDINFPELANQDEQAEYWFAQGHEVGVVARDLHPGGILIGDEGTLGLDLATQQTHELLAGPMPVPLFEATFSYQEVLIRADIVIPGDDGLLLREVKSAAKLKAYHVPDCAIQAWVMARAGYAPARVELAHINTSFRYEEEGEYDGLITCQDITDQVADLQELVSGWVEGARSTLKGPLPDIEPGMQCVEPFDCPFMNYCWQRVPEYPVETLPGKGKVVDELLEQGITDIRDIPDGMLTKPLQERVRNVVKNGQAFLDPDAEKELANLPYPRFYLDFETIGFAVPIWLHTRPFEPLPFQWSCHIEQQPGEIEHEAFLDLSGEAPMRSFAESLLALLGKQGKIFMYSNYERTVIAALMRRYPDLADELSPLLDRFFDLQKVAKKYYYHPAMKGRWSIKTVLPTIAPELDYSQLDGVQNGTEAQMAYRECVAPGTTDEEKRELEQRLLEYCKMDTLAMVKIAAYFSRDLAGD